MVLHQYCHVVSLCTVLPRSGWMNKDVFTCHVAGLRVLRSRDFVPETPADTEAERNRILHGEPFPIKFSGELTITQCYRKIRWESSYLRERECCTGTHFPSKTVQQETGIQWASPWIYKKVKLLLTRSNLTNKQNLPSLWKHSTNRRTSNVFILMVILSDVQMSIFSK